MLSLSRLFILWAFIKSLYWVPSFCSSKSTLPLFQSCLFPLEIKDRRRGSQAVYFRGGFFPSELRSSLSLSRRLWLLSGGSFCRATQRRYCVSVTAPSFALPGLGALIAARCCQSQATALSLLFSLKQASQSGLHIRTTILLSCSGCMLDLCCPSEMQFELHMLS